MNADISFAPLLPWAVIAALAAGALAVTLLAAVRRSPGWPVRGLAFLALLFALANPSVLTEDRTPLRDVAFLVHDLSASQTIEDRADATASARAEIEQAIADLARRSDGADAIDLRIIETRETGEEGTRLLSALDAAAAEVAPDRIAGAILITDGQVSDADLIDRFPAPVHSLVTGREDETDRHLMIERAPTFGLVGETVTLDFRVEELGVPSDRLANVLISVDGDPVQEFQVRPGMLETVEIEITHGGANVIEIAAEPGPDELTDRNNRAVLTINGVRDRLRVLLVSGEPHAGERTWRNLLKADPSVDLVHFTILRPPTKQDGAPVEELSLIAFPTRELFQDKIDEFDLIIFDRYRRRGVLPSAYLRNIARYVRDGGAVLIASGPAFAGIESLYRTPLSEVTPARPTAEVIQQGFRPEVTELGARHPVTAGLRGGEEGEPPWGRWFRLIDVEALSGQTVMTGVDDRPLLILDRVETGRIAVLASDHAWLWTRGFEGGGPQAELLRRLAHWLMKEPELEEEAMTVEIDGDQVMVTRRSVTQEPTQLSILSPSGPTLCRGIAADGAGRWRAFFEAPEQGLYRLTDGAVTAVAPVGPPSPAEFANPISTTSLLGPVAEATGGDARRLEAGGAAPDLRLVREGRNAEGRGWIGLVRREAYTVDDVRLTPLAPAWVMLLISAALFLATWRVEGR